MPSAEDHAVAVLAMIDAGTPPDVVVYDANVPRTSSQMYAVVYPDPGARDRSSIRAVSDLFVMTVQVTCVGLSDRQARYVSDLVCVALVDQRPTVAGRTCWPITQQDPAPPVIRDDDDRDPTTGQPRFYLTPRFVIRSTV